MPLTTKIFSVERSLGPKILNSMQLRPKFQTELQFCLKRKRPAQLFSLGNFIFAPLAISLQISFESCSKGNGSNGTFLFPFLSQLAPLHLQPTTTRKLLTKTQKIRQTSENNIPFSLSFSLCVKETNSPSFWLIFPWKLVALMNSRPQGMKPQKKNKFKRLENRRSTKAIVGRRSQPHVCAVKGQVKRACHRLHMAHFILLN